MDNLHKLMAVIDSYPIRSVRTLPSICYLLKRQGVDWPEVSWYADCYSVYSPVVEQYLHHLMVDLRWVEFKTHSTFRFRLTPEGKKEIEKHRELLSIKEKTKKLTKGRMETAILQRAWTSYVRK